MGDFFEDKSFIVTGASSGIGRGLAAMLAGRGAKAVAMARTLEKLETLKKQAGSNIIVFQGDVTREDDCKAAIDLAVSTTGKLDGIVHSAGITMRGLAEEADIQVYRDIMEVNFFSMLYFFKHGLAHVIRTKGHIAAVSSMMGRYSTQERSGYNASKHALQGYLNSVRLEIMEKGVHVMVISPGFVQTDGSLNALTADGSPYGKMDDALVAGLTPEQTAEIILDGIKHRKRDVFPAGFKEKLGLFLSKWVPSTLDRMLIKSKVK